MYTLHSYTISGRRHFALAAGPERQYGWCLYDKAQPTLLPAQLTHAAAQFARYLFLALWEA